MTGTNNKPGSTAFYPPYFAFVDGKSFKVYRIDSKNEVISGQLKENILNLILDDGFAVFVLNEKLVTLDFGQRKFTGLSPLPVDFRDPHIEGGRLNGYGVDRFYSINYSGINSGAVPEILDFPFDNMTDCVTVSGSADAYCAGTFLRAKIKAGLPSEKTAIAEGLTLHMHDGVLTALADNYTYTKEVEMNFGGVQACVADNGTCWLELDGNPYCMKNGKVLKQEKMPDNCEKAEFKDGYLMFESKPLMRFAEEVNSSETHIMWKRVKDGSTYYFFTKKVTNSK